MNQTLLSLLSASLLLSACGVVEAPNDSVDSADLDSNGEPSADSPPTGDDATPDDDAGLPPDDDDMPPADDDEDVPPDEELEVVPLLVDGSQAATSSLALSRLSLVPGITPLTRQQVRDVVRGDGDPRDVAEVRVVTTTSDAFQLTIEMTEPSGTYARTIGTDGGIVVQTTTGSVQCVAFGTALNKPECNTAVPGAYEKSASGPLTARWSIRMIDDHTQAPVSCTTEERRAVCSVPGRAFTAYRIEVGVTELADLYADEGDAGLGFEMYSEYGALWLGRIVLTPRCTRFRTESLGNVYCEQWDTYGRGRGIDQASITVQPVALTLSAGSASATVQTPTVNWGTGDQDLPGPTY